VRAIVFAVCSLFLLVTAVAPEPPEPYRVALQPLGTASRGEVAVVKSNLEATYNCTVTILPDQPLPQEAWYEPRKRWRADRILDALEAVTPRDYDKVLALTERDISVPKEPYPDWGIFGLGQMGGRPAVVSTFRLHRGRASEGLFRDRLEKVALHEVGHLFGLPHCPTAGCLMEDAKGTIATVDRGGKTFCATCEAALRKIRALN